MTKHKGQVNELQNGAMTNKNVIFGYKSNFVANIHECLERLSDQQGLVFAAIPLFHPRFRRDNNGISDGRSGPKTRSDRVIESNKWISNIVGVLSPWIDLENDAPSISLSSETALFEEFNWGCHLGMQSLLLPTPSKSPSPNYSRCILQLCSQAQYQQLWVRIPLLAPLTHCNTTINDGMMFWCSLHKLCNYHHKLAICLEITKDLPDDIHDSIHRWSGDSVKAAIINTNIFLTNRNGYPVLSKQHQMVLEVLLKFRLHVIFEGRPHHGEADSYLLYVQYIQHLYTKMTKPISEEEKFTFGYRDTLQAPLQPLMDNLEAQTYEVFERDPVKYAQYEEAIRKALPIAKLKVGTKDVVCMVVGAGRGPLVACCLAASATTAINVKIYAVEKNDNAIITLRNRAITERWSSVEIIHADMRFYQAEHLADIIISELLGSWGDNELSPECLDGAQRLLKPDGISIPSSYTSFIAPMSSSRLWMGARDMPDRKGLETPFVVKFHNCHVLTQSLPLFTFVHPNEQKSPNKRYDDLLKDRAHRRLVNLACLFE